MGVAEVSVLGRGAGLALRERRLPLLLQVGDVHQRLRLPIRAHARRLGHCRPAARCPWQPQARQFGGVRDCGVRRRPVRSAETLAFCRTQEWDSRERQHISKHLHRGSRAARMVAAPSRA